MTSTFLRLSTDRFYNGLRSIAHAEQPGLVGADVPGDGVGRRPGALTLYAPRFILRTCGRTRRLRCEFLRTSSAGSRDLRERRDVPSRRRLLTGWKAASRRTTRKNDRCGR